MPGGRARLSFYALDKGRTRYMMGDMLVHEGQKNGRPVLGSLVRPLRTLMSVKNGGLVAAANGRDVLELSYISPTTVVYAHPHANRSAPATVHAQTDAPTGMVPNLHNSINPLWIAEWGCYLGMGHRDTHVARADDSRRHYYQVFFTLDAAMERIRRYSPPFYLPDLDAAEVERTGRRIQFVMGATRVGVSTVVVTYGVDDCSSAVLTLDLAQIEGLLSGGV